MLPPPVVPSVCNCQRREGGQRGGDVGAQAGIGHAAAGHGAPGDGDGGAGRVDDRGVGVGQHRPQRRVGVDRAGAGRGVDPGDRLLVEGARVVVADQPVEQVLEGARQRTGVLGGGEEEGVGPVDGRAQLVDGGVERWGVTVRVEVRQTVEPVRAEYTIRPVEQDVPSVIPSL